MCEKPTFTNFVQFPSSCARLHSHQLLAASLLKGTRALFRSARTSWNTSFARYFACPNKLRSSVPPYKLSQDRVRSVTFITMKTTRCMVPDTTLQHTSAIFSKIRRFKRIPFKSYVDDHSIVFSSLSQTYLEFAFLLPRKSISAAATFHPYWAMLNNFGYFRFYQILTNLAVDIGFILPAYLLLHKSISQGGNKFDFTTGSKD